MSFPALSVLSKKYALVKSLVTALLPCAVARCFIDSDSIRIWLYMINMIIYKKKLFQSALSKRGDQSIIGWHYCY